MNLMMSGSITYDMFYFTVDWNDLIIDLGFALMVCTYTNK